jgi:hypothetical protein
MYYKIVSSVKFGAMVLNNQILSCLINWSSFINRYDQLQNNFKKVFIVRVLLYLCNNEYKNKDVCDYVPSSGLGDLVQHRGSG